MLYTRLLFLVSLVFSVDAFAQDVTQTYVSCRCCCSTEENVQLVCLSERKGATLADVIAADAVWQKTPAALCPKEVPCTQAVRFRYCDGGDASRPASRLGLD